MHIKNFFVWDFREKNAENAEKWGKMRKNAEKCDNAEKCGKMRKNADRISPPPLTSTYISSNMFFTSQKLNKNDFLMKLFLKKIPLSGMFCQEVAKH